MAGKTGGNCQKQLCMAYRVLHFCLVVWAGCVFLCRVTSCSMVSFVFFFLLISCADGVVLLVGFVSSDKQRVPGCVAPYLEVISMGLPEISLGTSC